LTRFAKESGMKGLVVYYSEKGSNRVLARRIAEKTGFDMEEIRPRVNSIFPLILGSFTKSGLGNKKINRNIAAYDTIILCGPIWVGQVIYPLSCFIKKYKSQINKLYFITCCGGGDDQKDSKFGYETVFTKMKRLLGDKFAGGFAMPIKLLIPPGDPEDGVMKTRLSSGNFSFIEQRLTASINGILEAGVS